MLIALIASLMNALYWISLIRFALHRKFQKNYKFSKLEKKLFKILDDRILVDWYDIKYFYFSLFFYTRFRKNFHYYPINNKQSVIFDLFFTKIVYRLFCT